MIVNSALPITVTRVVATVRLYNNISENAVHRQSRNRWAVALKSSGATYYTAGGKDILSDRFHPVILPKGSSYSWKCTEPGECLLIEFEALQTQTTISAFSLSNAGFFVRDFYKIQQLLAEGTPESQLEATYKLYGILLRLFRGHPKEHVSQGKRQLLKPAVDYMGEHFRDHRITNSSLAACCGISTVYFRKCFEETYGISPIRYLHDYRMQKAKQILASDYGSIGQVAEDVGYSNLYHFSKMFRQYTGLSPSQYAKASRSLT